MALTQKIENRLLIAGTAVITIITTVLLMNFMVIMPLRKTYEIQIKKQNELIVELAKISKYSIQNTYTIKKPKKGSIVILAPENDMDIQEVTKALDAKMVNIMTPADSMQQSKTVLSWFKRVFNRDKGQ